MFEKPTAKAIFYTSKKSQALALLLRENFPKYNNNAIISSGGVWLNSNRIINPKFQIAAGKTIKFFVSPTQGYRYLFSDESIIKETDDWIVVYKEPLITVAMDRSNINFNLMAGLNDYYGFCHLNSGVQPITRLDYRVAGLCLFSKNKAAERRLFMLMQNRRIKKRYMAVTKKCKINQTRFTVTNKLGFKNKAFIDEKNGKQSKTYFIFDSHYGDYSIFNAVTKTGRRHQVRIHSTQSFGPLINDDQYSKEYKSKYNPIGLVASYIGFKWNGKYQKIYLPDSFKQKAISDLTFNW